MEAKMDSKPPNLTETESSSLQNLSRILCLLHHRSKNQHRRSTWFRHFNTFRRQLHHLLSDMNPKVLATWPPSRKRKLREECQVRLDQRLQFWTDVLVVKWFEAFSQILADRQFAAIGLVLLAVLGDVCRISGVLGRIEEGGDEAFRRALGEFADGEERGFRDVLNLVDGEDDLGVPIERARGDENIGMGGLNADDASIQSNKREIEEVAQPSNEEAPPSKKRKKSRKRKGDAIDDLFAGLF